MIQEPNITLKASPTNDFRLEVDLGMGKNWKLLLFININLLKKIKFVNIDLLWIRVTLYGKLQKIPFHIFVISFSPSYYFNSYSNYVWSKNS